MPGPLLAISFDAAGTLFRLAAPVGETYAAHAGRHGLPLPSGVLDREFRAAWKAAPDPHESPAGAPSLSTHTSPEERERAWWRSVVADTFRRAAQVSGVPPPPAPVMDRLFEELFRAYADPALWRLYPETLEVLDALADRFRLVVISNFDGRFHRIADGLGLTPRFEAVFLSGEVGAAKPDPAIFAAAAATLGVAPGRILHVGDDPRADGEGARRSGFRCRVLRRPRQSLRTVFARI